MKPAALAFAVVAAGLAGCLTDLERTEGAFPASFLPPPVDLDPGLAYLADRQFPHPIHPRVLQLEVTESPGMVQNRGFDYYHGWSEEELPRARMALYGVPDSTATYDLAVLVLQYDKPSYARGFILDAAHCSLGDVWLRDGDVAIAVLASGTGLGETLAKKAIAWIESHSGARHACGSIGGTDAQDASEDGRDLAAFQSKLGADHLRGSLRPKGDVDFVDFRLDGPCFLWLGLGHTTADIRFTLSRDQVVLSDGDTRSWDLPDAGDYRLEMRSVDPAFAPDYVAMPDFWSSSHDRTPCPRVASL